MSISSRRGFTLVEMLVVMAVIVVLAGLVLSVNAGAQRKAASQRAQGEIKAYEAAISSYSADNNGDVPREAGITEPTTAGGADGLDPRVDGNPNSEKYKKANRVLYKALSGDENLNFKASGKAYFEFKPDHLNAAKNNGKITAVNFIQDPWGNCYGYSTAGMLEEQDYREKLRTDATVARPAKPKGYNPSPDLWSTGGSLSDTPAPGGSNSVGPFRDSGKWVKNWR